MMEQPPLHRHYLHFSELPFSLRVLYTGTLLILGMGYLFALIYLYHTYAGRDGEAGLSYQDVVVAYSGSGKGSRLESSLRGPMSSMLPQDELNAVMKWSQEGADREKYEKEIKKTMEQRCVMCHDGSNPHLSNLSNFDGLKKTTEKDTGTDIFTLVRVSHIHMFGFTFIFFPMGLIFSHAYLRPTWLKATIMGLPFLATVLDVSSWYFTKLYHPFALVTMGAGAMMGICFAAMWVIAMYQLWFSKVPTVVKQRTEVELPTG
jgi:hypothetical protein